MPSLTLEAYSVRLHGLIIYYPFILIIVSVVEATLFVGLASGTAGVTRFYRVDGSQGVYPFGGALWSAMTSNGNIAINRLMITGWWMLQRELPNMPSYVSPVGPSRYWQWLQATSPCATPLAWCHTTDAYALRSMIDSGVLKPQLCKVFSQDLSYFFYGRPALRRAQGTAHRTVAKAEIVIVLDPQLAALGTRLFPFDTGGFSCGRYKEWLHRSMQLSDFELSCLSDGAQRHVTALFRTNDRYLRLETQEPAVSYAGMFEVQSLVSLLKDRDTSRSDDRRAAVELQVARKIPFDYPMVRAIVLPDAMLQAPYVQDFRAGRGARIEFREYPFTPLRNEGEYQVHLENLVHDLQKRWGLL